MTDHKQNLTVINGTQSMMGQFSTFTLHKKHYGIDVQRVQEVVKPMPITPVPNAPDFVLGLINLRGQIATAIGLAELSGMDYKSHPAMMNIICNIEGNLIALLVDEIGDVMELSSNEFEATPQTVPEKIRKVLSGVYKAKTGLISIVDVSKIGYSIGAKKAA